MTRLRQALCALWHWCRYRESHLCSYGFRNGKLYWYCCKCGKEEWDS